MKRLPAHPDDPFAGYPPQPIKCRWLSEHDERIAGSAQLIRLIVDEQRGHVEPWANDVWQRRFLREVSDFIGATDAVVVSYAGTLTAYIAPLNPTLDSLNSGLLEMQQALNGAELGPHEMLVGIDGAECNHATHFQAVVHLTGQPVVSRANTTLKIYPAGKVENRTLFGWRLCQQLAEIPAELAQTRRVETAAGTVLVLVCNDAAIFSARSMSNLKDEIGLQVREHFLAEAMREPRPSYILIATHWNGMNQKTRRWGGESFRTSAKYLNEQSGATVVTTMRAPRHQLEAAARRFEPIGLLASRVATVLVEDTFVEKSE
jgi:hypothetical protein